MNEREQQRNNGLLSAMPELQYDIHKWRKKNFPNATSDQMIKGVMEELGELARADLKLEQNIRTNEDHEEKMWDAIGDMCIFLMGFCSYKELDFMSCIINAWDEVQQRDWQKNKENGK